MFIRRSIIQQLKKDTGEFKNDFKYKFYMGLPNPMDFQIACSLFKRKMRRQIKKISYEMDEMYFWRYEIKFHKPMSSIDNSPWSYHEVVYGRLCEEVVDKNIWEQVRAPFLSPFRMCQDYAFTKGYYLVDHSDWKKDNNRFDFMLFRNRPHDLGLWHKLDIPFSRSIKIRNPCVRMDQEALIEKYAKKRERLDICPNVLVEELYPGSFCSDHSKKSSEVPLKQTSLSRQTSLSDIYQYPSLLRREKQEEFIDKLTAYRSQLGYQNGKIGKIRKIGKLGTGLNDDMFIDEDITESVNRFLTRVLN
jgi:hypothetical protein